MLISLSQQQDWNLRPAVVHVNRKKTENHKKVEQLKIKHIRILKAVSLVIYYKFIHSDEIFKKNVIVTKYHNELIIGRSSAVPDSTTFSMIEKCGDCSI